MENEITKDNGRTIVDWETLCCVLKYLLLGFKIEIKKMTATRARIFYSQSLWAVADCIRCAKIHFLSRDF